MKELKIGCGKPIGSKIGESDSDQEKGNKSIKKSENIKEAIMS